MWLNIALSCKTREQCVFWIFFKTGLCSVISLKRFRQELFIDVAEHRSVLKNYQNTLYSHFSFITKRGTAFPNTGVVLTMLFLGDFHGKVSDLY